MAAAPPDRVQFIDDIAKKVWNRIVERVKEGASPKIPKETVKATAKELIPGLSPADQELILQSILQQKLAFEMTDRKHITNPQLYPRPTPKPEPTPAPAPVIIPTPAPEKPKRERPRVAPRAAAPAEKNLLRCFSEGASFTAMFSSLAKKAGTWNRTLWHGSDTEVTRRAKFLNELETLKTMLKDSECLDPVIREQVYKQTSDLQDHIREATAGDPKRRVVPATEEGKEILELIKDLDRTTRG